MSTLEGAQGKENGLILGAQNLIALGIDPNDTNAKQKILQSLSYEYRAEKRRGNTNLTKQAWLAQRLNTIGEGLNDGAGIDPVINDSGTAKTQDVIDDARANGLFQQDQLAEDSWTQEDRDSKSSRRSNNDNSVAGFYVRDGQSVEAKAKELEETAEKSNDQDFKDRVARFREEAKTQSYGLRAADDGSTYADTDEPTLVDMQNTVVGNPHLNQELQGRRQRERDFLEGQHAVFQDHWITRDFVDPTTGKRTRYQGRSSPAIRADNETSAFLEALQIGRQRQDDADFVNTIRAIRGLGAEANPFQPNGQLKPNPRAHLGDIRTAVPGLPGESTWVDSVSGEPIKSTANTPDSAQALNAPQLSKAQQALFDFIEPRKFENSTDGGLRQVNISQITNDFYRRIGKTPVQGAPLIDSFQDELRAIAREKEVFYDDPIKLDNGKTYRPRVGGDSGRPKTINAILNSLGYEPYEKDLLANALNQELLARRTTNVASTKERPIAFETNPNPQERTMDEDGLRNKADLNPSTYGRPSIDFRQIQGMPGTPPEDLKAAQERVTGSIPGVYTRPSTGTSAYRQEPYETRRVYLNKETGQGYTPREAMARAIATGSDLATARRIGTDNAALRRDQKRTDESTALRRMLGQSAILTKSRNPNTSRDPKYTRPNSFWPGLGVSGGAAPARNAEDTKFFQQATSNAMVKGEMAEREALRRLITQGTSSSAPADTFVSYIETPGGGAARVERGVGPLAAGTKLQVPAFNDSRFAPTSARDTTGDARYIRSRERRPVGTVSGDPSATPQVLGNAVGAVNSEKAARIKRNREKTRSRVSDYISDVLESSISEMSYETEQVPSDVLRLAQRAGEGTLTDSDITSFRQWSQGQFANDRTVLGEIEAQLSEWPTTAVTQKNAQEARAFTPTAVGGAEPPANTTPLPSAARPVQQPETGGALVPTVRPTEPAAPQSVKQYYDPAPDDRFDVANRFLSSYTRSPEPETAATPDNSQQQALVLNKPSPGSGPQPKPNNNIFSKERRRRTLLTGAGALAGVGLIGAALNQPREEQV